MSSEDFRLKQPISICQTETKIPGDGLVYKRAERTLSVKYMYVLIADIALICVDLQATMPIHSKQ